MILYHHFTLKKKKRRLDSHDFVYSLKEFSNPQKAINKHTQGLPHVQTIDVKVGQINEGGKRISFRRKE